MKKTDESQMANKKKKEGDSERYRGAVARRGNVNPNGLWELKSPGTAQRKKRFWLISNRGKKEKWQPTGKKKK